MITAGRTANAQNPPIPAGATADASGDVTVTDLAANDLGRDPTLSAGERVIVAAGGFAPGASVELSTTGTALLPAAIHAGPSGVVRVVYDVPRTFAPGRHELVFLGSGPNGGGSTTPSDPNAMTLTVVVPNLCRFDFTTAAANTRRS